MQLVVTAVRGDSGTGYIAMDDFLFLDDFGICSTKVIILERKVTSVHLISIFQPDDAEPHPTEPTPTEYPPTIKCSFESDFCNFEVSGDPSFNFSRAQVT